MYYVVDASNRIVDVGDAWDEVAESVSAPGAMRERIVGRLLDDFMTGDATKMFVRAALDAARLLSETRVLPYRCDSPAERRRFDMVISLMGQGLVKVDHRLVSVQPRLPQRQRPAARPWADSRCSQCFAVRLTGGEWVEVEGHALLPQDVCPNCVRQLFDVPSSTPEPAHD